MLQRIGRASGSRCSEMEATIDSRVVWVDTGVRVVAGRSYQFSAMGRRKEAGIDTDAAGSRSANMWVAN